MKTRVMSGTPLMRQLQSTVPLTSDDTTDPLLHWQVKGREDEARGERVLAAQPGLYVRLVPFSNGKLGTHVYFDNDPVQAIMTQNGNE